MSRESGQESTFESAVVVAGQGQSQSRGRNQRLGQRQLSGKSLAMLSYLPDSGADSLPDSRADSPPRSLQPFAGSYRAISGCYRGLPVVTEALLQFQLPPTPGQTQDLTQSLTLPGPVLTEIAQNLTLDPTPDPTPDSTADLALTQFLWFYRERYPNSRNLLL